MALAIGYICIVVSISFVFFIYHQINPNEAKIIVKEPPGDQAPNQTKHPSAPTTEPPPPPDVVKLMESALLQAKDLLKILDKAVVELEIKKLDVEAKVKEVKNEKRLLSNALNAKQVDKENAEIDAAKKAKALADLETQANDQNPNSRRKADQARKKMPSAITDDKAAKEKALESKRAFKEAKAADEEADHKLVRAEQELTKALANVETTTVKKTNAATAVDNIQKAIDAFEAAKKASDALK
jgi:chromosome segregation ATPase